MSFTPESWRATAQNNVKKEAGWLARLKTRYAPYTVYGYLSSMALCPLVEALGAGQVFPVMNALGQIAGSVGGNLLANRFEAWRQQADQLSPETVAITIQSEVATEADLREALDAVLAKLDLIPQAQHSLSQADQQ